MSEKATKRGRPRKIVYAKRHEVVVKEHKNGAQFEVSWPAPEKGQRRRRRTFATKTAAEQFASTKRTDFTNRGRRVAGLRATAAEDAAEAAALLLPYGVSILDAARDYVARAAARLRSMLVPDAVEAFLDARKPEVSQRYFGDLRARLNRFAAAFPEHHVSDFAPKDLAVWLADPNRSAIDRGNTRRVLSVFFGWAKLNHYANSNPVEDVPAPKEPDPPCEVFTPAEMRNVLAACPAELLPFVAIQAFSGVRSSEVGRLDWREIDFRRGLIRLDSGKTKTGARRFVPIPDVLAAWLMPHAQLAGKITPRNLNARLVKFRKVLATMKDEERRVTWKHNALRHSFASYALAKYEDAPKVALWCGHDVKTLLAHYRDLVAPQDAEDWFAIFPDAVAAEDKGVAV